MSDQTGPVESNLGTLARELVKYAKIIDETNERIDALESTVVGLRARVDAAR